MRYPTAYECLVTAGVVKMVMRRDQPSHLGHVSFRCDSAAHVGAVVLRRLVNLGCIIRVDDGRLAAVVHEAGNELPQEIQSLQIHPVVGPSLNGNDLHVVSGCQLDKLGSAYAVVVEKCLDLLRVARARRLANIPVVMASMTVAASISGQRCSGGHGLHFGLWTGWLIASEAREAVGGESVCLSGNLACNHVTFRAHGTLQTEGRKQLSHFRRRASYAAEESLVSSRRPKKLQPETRGSGGCWRREARDVVCTEVNGRASLKSSSSLGLEGLFIRRRPAPRPRSQAATSTRGPTRTTRLRHQPNPAKSLGPKRAARLPFSPLAQCLDASLASGRGAAASSSAAALVLRRDTCVAFHCR